jgi:pimeloyl-ACP methyl ester carboxylesterase
VGCNDYPMIWDKEASEPERRAQLEEAIREYDPDVLAPFSPREVALSSDFGYLECLTWPQPTERYEPPVPPGAEPPRAPVLVVAGEMDDVTTPHEGRVVADLFPDSTFFEERNAGHTQALYYYQGPSAVEIRRFLRDALDPQA